MFMNPRFEPSPHGQRDLSFEVEGGVVSRGGELRGLIHVAKAHYRDATVWVVYHGGSESF